MMEMGSLVCGCHYAVQIPDDIDTANVLTLLQTRLSAMAGFPDLYKEALGISPFLLDMKSGAIYWCLARVPLLTVRPRLPALRGLPCWRPIAPGTSPFGFPLDYLTVCCVALYLAFLQLPLCILLLRLRAIWSSEIH